MGCTWDHTRYFATHTDRSVAAVLELLLCDDSYQRSYMGPVDFPELVATAYWYLWWQRRQFVRGDEVYSPEQTMPAIIVLVFNFVHAMGKVLVAPKFNKCLMILAGQ